MYTELHCHTHFSFLDGASSPVALVERALELGMTHLAVTDHQGLYGVIRFYNTARALGLAPVIGLEVTLTAGHDLTLLARDNTGYRSLCRLVSRGQLQGSKHAPEFTPDDLALHANGLIALSGCRKGEVASHVLRGDYRAARTAIRRLASLYGEDNLWIELQDHILPDSQSLCRELAALADGLGIGCVATNNVHYAERDGRRLHDVLTCIRHNTTLDDSMGALRPNSEYYLKSEREMRDLFHWRLDAVENTGTVAASCSVNLEFSRHRHPRYPLPHGHSERSYLARLCLDGAVRRYGKLDPKVFAQLRHELSVIHDMGLDNFFLVVWDVVRHARESGIPVQGRGSAADSLVAFVLGITRVDPIRHELLFERFLNPERKGMPDIDLDVSTAHREELIQWVYERYGEAHTAMAATLITFRGRSAVRDVGKVLGFPPDVIDATARTLDSYSDAEKVRREVEATLGGRPPEDLPWGQLLDLCEAIVGFPRHLGIHVGGMILTEGPLADMAPLERAAAPGRVVTQYDKDDLEDLGVIKIDLLGLRTLSLIHDALDAIEEETGQRPDLDRLPEDDEGVFDMLCKADSVGVFQVESRAQSQTLPRLLPRTLDDLIVEVAIIRPGPIQAGMVHPYLRRRQGLEPVTYIHPSLEPILGETMGVCLFQEQVIRIATDVAGFSPGAADLFRRAMGSHRSRDAMERIHTRFVAGCLETGLSHSQAEELFRQIEGFASFGFLKSHASAFAKTTYETAWLKLHHPAAFYVGLLNAQPMGFYSPEVIIGDARRHGIRTLSVDINRSRARCTVEGGHIRLGYSYVRDLGEHALETLEREQGPYGGLEEFCRRTRLERDAVESLVFSGAFDRFGERRQLFWELGRILPEAPHRRQSPRLLDQPWDEQGLRRMSVYEQVAEEYELSGLSAAHHLLEFHRLAMRRAGVTTARDLEEMHGGRVRVAGLLVCKQAPPTAKGHTFLTLEDESGLVNVILRPRVYERYRRYIRGSPLLLVEGVLQTDSGVQSVLATRLAPWRNPPAPEV